MRLGFAFEDKAVGGEKAVDGAGAVVVSNNQFVGDLVGFDDDKAADDLAGGAEGVGGVERGEGVAAFAVELPALVGHAAASLAGALDGFAGVGLAVGVHVLLVLYLLVQRIAPNDNDMLQLHDSMTRSE